MSFWDNETVQDLTQLHIEKVSNLEDRQAKKLFNNLKVVRGQLTDRLLSAREGTFTEQHLRATLVQVDQYLQALNTRLKEGMGESAGILGERGVEDLITEIERFSKKFDGDTVPINLDAAMIAQESNNLLVNQYDASIDAYTEGVRQQITQGLTESVLSQDNLSRVVQKLGQFVGAEEWKVLRLARTELHNVYGKAKLNGMLDIQEQVLPDLKKTLIHPMDKRTGDDSKYVAKKGLVADLDEPFRYNWKGKERVFMTPPDRPNDRSILVPYREAWG